MSNGVRDLMAITRMFSDVFNEDFSDRNVFNEFYTIANYPPTDLYLKEDSKNWVFEFALAFYEEDEIDISFNGDYMNLKVEKKNSEKLNQGKKYIHKGVKFSRIDNNYYLPMAKFDTANAVANFKNGILSVEIPVKAEHLPKKILINKS